MTQSRSPAAVVQAAYAAFGVGDVQGVLALCSDEAIWSMNGPSNMPYGGHFRGKEEILQWFVHVGTHDDIKQFEPREFFEGPTHCTVLGWEKTADRTTGKVFECEWTHLFEVKDGKIVRFVGSFDREARYRAALLRLTKERMRWMICPARCACRAVFSSATSRSSLLICRLLMRDTMPLQ